MGRKLTIDVKIQIDVEGDGKLEGYGVGVTSFLDGSGAVFVRPVVGGVERPEKLSIDFYEAEVSSGGIIRDPPKEVKIEPKNPIDVFYGEHKKLDYTIIHPLRGGGGVEFRTGRGEFWRGQKFSNPVTKILVDMRDDMARALGIPEPPK